MAVGRLVKKGRANARKGSVGRKRRGKRPREPFSPLAARVRSSSRFSDWGAFVRSIVRQNGGCREAARRLGIPHQSLYRWSVGKKAPNDRTISRVAAATGLPQSGVALIGAGVILDGLFLRGGRTIEELQERCIRALERRANLRPRDGDDG